MGSVLRVGRVLVHVSLPILINDNPAHLDGGVSLPAREPVRQALYTQRQRDLGAGIFEPIGTMVVPHVPKGGAHILRHAYAVTGICRRGHWQNWRLFPVLSFHLSTGLEAATCKDDATPRFHRDASSVLIAKMDAEHLAPAGCNKALRREGAPHLDVAPCDIVLQHLQHAPAVAGSAAAKMWIQRLGVVEARDFDDVGVVEGVVAGERIVSAVMADAHLCAV